MKLRVRGAGRAEEDTGARSTPGLMLSPGADLWCRVDAARGVTGADGSVSVLLTGMQPHQVSGLLDLRDGAPIDLYATPAVFEHLTVSLPVLPVLQQFCGVHWHLIPVAGEQRSADFAVEGCPTLSFTAVTAATSGSGERIALAVRDERTGARLFIVDGASLAGGAFDTMADWMWGADCVVIDRAPHHKDTVWLDRLSSLSQPRKLLLDANGSDRSLYTACGIECADALLEFEL